MVYVTCVRIFVDPSEVGQQWVFPTLADAEHALGWHFVHNHCTTRSGNEPCGYSGCSYCDPIDYQ